MSKNSLAPRRPCKGRGTACGGRVGGEGHEVARGLASKIFFNNPSGSLRSPPPLSGEARDVKEKEYFKKLSRPPL